MASMPASTETAGDDRTSGPLWTQCPAQAPLMLADVATGDARAHPSTGLTARVVVPWDFCLSLRQAAEIHRRALERKAASDTAWSDEHARALEAEDETRAAEARNTRSTIVGIAVSVGSAALGSVVGALVDRAVRR